MISMKDFKSMDNLMQFLSFFNYLTPDDNVIVVSDSERIVRVFQGFEFNLPIHEGKIPQGSSLTAAMKQGKRVSMIIEKNVYGVRFLTLTNPIADESGKIVGAVAVCKDIELQEKLMGVAENLSSSLEQISAGIGDIANNAQFMVTAQDKMNKSANDTIASMKQTNEVLEFIRAISNQTNMLGLNAAMEAARAGEHGKGFSVVAEEVRKLSTSSTDAAKKINDILTAASESVGKIVSEVKGTAGAVEQQAAATQEINASIQELNSIADLLVEMGKKL